MPNCCAVKGGETASGGTSGGTSGASFACTVNACGTCAHATNIKGEALKSDCNSCSQKVCDADPYCCNTTWDFPCVVHAEEICGG
jgi:hypothetical protein